MTELTKYQEIKMYLSINGYDSIKELAKSWDVSENAIRQNARGNMVSANLSNLIDEFIKAGEKRFQQYRESKLASSNQNN